MIPAQFHVDIITELEHIIPSYKLLVPSFVIDELENIQRKSKGKDKTAAAIALKIAKKPPITIIHISLRKDERVDDALVRISKVLCTNDRELRKRARDRRTTVIYLRQKKYLAVEGHLNL